MKSHRTSKYVGKTFDNGWQCVSIEVAYVQPAKAKYPGHMTYKYVFRRKTSDDLAYKYAVVDCVAAAKIYAGKATVEEFASKHHYYKHSCKTVPVSYQYFECAE